MPAARLRPREYHILFDRPHRRVICSELSGQRIVANSRCGLPFLVFLVGLLRGPVLKPECRRFELYQNSMYLTMSRRACSRVGYWEGYSGNQEILHFRIFGDGAPSSSPVSPCRHSARSVRWPARSVCRRGGGECARYCPGRGGRGPGRTSCAVSSIAMPG